MISRDRLQRDLRSKFENDIVKRNIFGNIVVIVSPNIAVNFNLRNERVRIYARSRFIPLLLGSGNLMASGILEDQKSKYERKFVDWFSEKYGDYVAQK